MTTLSFDENVSYRVARSLRAIGHQVVTTDEARNKGVMDDVQLFFARQQGWTIVTHNMNDFLLMHRTLLRWSAVTSLVDTDAGIIALSEHVSNTAQA